MHYRRAERRRPFGVFCARRAAEGLVEVYRGPGADGYADVTQHGPADAVSPLAFPDVSFAVTDFFA
jgi:hypothetical protein